MKVLDYLLHRTGLPLQHQSMIRSIDSKYMGALVSHLKRDSRVFKSFCDEVLSCSRMDYLFALLPRVIPEYESPMAVLNESGDTIMEKLDIIDGPVGEKGDEFEEEMHHQKLSCLLYYAVAVQRAMVKSYHEKEGAI